MFYATQNQFGLTFDQVRKIYPSKSFPASGQINMPEVQAYTPSTTPTYDPATHAVREAAQAQFAAEDARAQVVAAGLRLRAYAGILNSK